ncbi:MAG: hypothetical protein Q9222_000552 [Ikaeria aurantiellina]
MLRDFGVEEIRVQEVVSLDSEMLAFLPCAFLPSPCFIFNIESVYRRPIYGLVFLFKWREEDPDKQEASCPEGIWFANQTVTNACASVALLNIVNNIPRLKLGEPLEQFKRFTADFTPALRGDAIANFEFVKNIHNSFARKTDMLNSDLQMKNDASSRRTGRTKGSDEDDAGFHFIAFVPVQGKVWKLDGLERQPQNLGSITSDDWVTQVAPEIELRMAQYEDGQIEFAILSLVKEPLTAALATLAENVKSLIALSQRLKHVTCKGDMGVSDVTDNSPWALQDTIHGPSEQYHLDQKTIEEATLCPAFKRQLASDKISELLTTRQELITAQASLRTAVRDEARAVSADYERATSRRNDRGLLANGLLEVLERMGKIREFLEPNLSPSPASTKD